MKTPQGSFNLQQPQWRQRMELQNIENSYPLLPRRQLSPPHPTGRTIQSITVISFDPLAAACLCQQSNKFNLYHTLIEGITNREGLSKNLLMKCYYTEWIIEMGEDSLGNLVTAETCTVSKSISYPNKEERGGKHKQCRKLNEELHTPPSVFCLSQIESMDFKLTSKSRLENSQCTRK